MKTKHKKSYKKPNIGGSLFPAGDGMFVAIFMLHGFAEGQAKATDPISAINAALSPILITLINRYHILEQRQQAFVHCFGKLIKKTTIHKDSHKALPCGTVMRIKNDNIELLFHVDDHGNQTLLQFPYKPLLDIMTK